MKLRHDAATTPALLLALTLAGCSITSVEGPTGPTGPSGDAGAQGMPGITGPQGQPGLPGPTGATGATGPAGSGPTGATGATGPAGSQGDAGGIGLPGRFPSDGLSFSILDAQLNADRSVSVHFSVLDGRGASLDLRDADRLGFMLSEVLPMPSTDAGVTGPLRYRAITLCAADPPNQAVQQPCMEWVVKGSAVDTSRAAQRTDGTWDLRLVQSVPADFDRTHTLSVAGEIRRPALLPSYSTRVASAFFDFVPAGGTPTRGLGLVDVASCNGCHMPVTGHQGTRVGIGLCERCHTDEAVDPDTGVNLSFGGMVHRIHRGKDLPSVVGGTPFRITGDNGIVRDFSHLVYPQDLRACETCHVPNAAAPNSARFATRTATVICTSCHDRTYIPAGTVPAGYTAHIVQGTDDSQCVLCHRDTGGPAAIRDRHVPPFRAPGAPTLALTIDAVSGFIPGGNPVVDFTVTDRAGAAITDLSALSSLRINLNGPTAPDYPGAPTTLTVVPTPSSNAGTVLNMGSGHFRYTAHASVTLPAAASGTWAVGMEGQRTQTYPDGGTFRHGAQNPVFYVSLTGGVVNARTQAVEMAKCIACHGELALHGRNRINNPQYCALCHTRTATDVARRPADAGAPQSIDLAVLAHRIHMGERLPTVAAGGRYVIYGFGNSANDFSNVRFPQSPANCTACHVSAAAAETPSTRICTSCHNAPASLAHAQINTAGGVEACATCHGPGREFSVQASHDNP